MDFILEQQGKVVALEVKGAETVGHKDLDGLTAFREAMGRKKGLARSVVLYGGKEGRALGEDCHALPWRWMFPA